MNSARARETAVSPVFKSAVPIINSYQDLARNKRALNRLPHRDGSQSVLCKIGPTPDRLCLRNKRSWEVAQRYCCIATVSPLVNVRRALHAGDQLARNLTPVVASAFLKCLPGLCVLMAALAVTLSAATLRGRSRQTARRDRRRAVGSRCTRRHGADLLARDAVPRKVGDQPRRDRGEADHRSRRRRTRAATCRSSAATARPRGCSSTTPTRSRGVIKIGTERAPDTLPQYIVIENLDVRERAARATPSPTTPARGRRVQANAARSTSSAASTSRSAAACSHDGGNGLFVGIYNGDTQDVLVDGNYLYDNGNAGSAFEHNNYTAAVGIVFQFNRFGPLRAGVRRQQPEGPLGRGRRPLQLDRERQPPARSGRRRGRPVARERPALPRRPSCTATC